MNMGSAQKLPIYEERLGIPVRPVSLQEIDRTIRAQKGSQPAPNKRQKPKELTCA